MAFNRVFREFRTWKHYRGGMADDVWIYDFKTGTTENLTNNPAQDICPMWGPDNKIYFISDRDGRMNLFSIDLASKETKQLTTFKDFDIKFPSIGKDAIVFEQAGYIWRYDLASGQAAPVPIEIKEDFASGRSALSRCLETYPIGQSRAGWSARHRRRAWRSLFGAGEGRHAAQPHQDLERARARRGLVAGRQMDRLQLRRDRRERALRSFAGRQRPAATGHERRRHLLLSAYLVA